MVSKMAGHEKDLEIGLLLDFYGELLSDSRREAVSLYYNEDLSLAEVAGELGITRQGVRDSLAKARAQLFSFEEKLGLAGRFHAIEKTLDDLIPRLEKLRDASSGETHAELDDMIAEAKHIHDLN